LKKLTMFLNENEDIFLGFGDDSPESNKSQNSAGREICGGNSVVDNNLQSTEQNNSKHYSEEHRREKLTELKQRISRRMNRRANQFMHNKSNYADRQSKDMHYESDESDVTPTVTPPALQEITPIIDTKEKLKQHDVTSVFDPSNDPHRSDVDETIFKNTKEFVNTPCSKGVLYRTFVVREPGKGFLSYPIFKVYSNKTKKFLMLSKKQGNSKTSHYLISTDMSSGISKQSESFVGKLRSNF